MSVRILIGDVRARLADLPDKSIHCCVTSPPYYNLRDYQTGSWDGGDPACDHIMPVSFKSSTLGAASGGNDMSDAARRRSIEAQATPYARRCGKCGATRADQQIGLEGSLADYLATLVDVFREVRRVLRDDGTLWLNIGSSYGPNKCDLMVPFRLAIALVDDGWIMRSSIIWHKRAPMPESVTDRPTSAHEHIFLLTKNKTYFYDADAVREEYETADRTGPRRSYEGTASSMNGDTHVPMTGPFAGLPLNPAGRNLRNVWTLSPEPFPSAHFAVFPTEIPRRCIKAGTSAYGCCASCGSPWRRVVERQTFYRPAIKLYGGTLGHNPTGTVPGSNTRGMPDPQPITTGWAPGCACGADVRPCVVLDCFAGSGTTGLVADELGRDAVLVELNPTYARLAYDRIHGASPMFAAVTLT